MLWSYNAVGNIRSRKASYHVITDQGAASSSLVPSESWFLYDSMNRMTLSGGRLVSGAVTGGTAITYDAGGRRRTAATSYQATATVANPNYDPFGKPTGGNTPTLEVPYTAQTLETYDYDASGNLWKVWIAGGGYEDNGNGGADPILPSQTTPRLKGQYGYDGLNRLVRQQDWTGDGSGVAYDRQVSYDGKGRVDSETVSQRQGTATVTTTTV
ncbi:hypothetical protein, partial [Sphingomonas sp. DT-204]|uniref:hypothetical protein n=1 Tax=Sphingomonas sp. DT-204 TaxID=3396166 RepID=UPI003F1D0EBF